MKKVSKKILLQVLSFVPLMPAALVKPYLQETSVANI